MNNVYIYENLYSMAVGDYITKFENVEDES